MSQFSSDWERLMVAWTAPQDPSSDTESSCCGGNNSCSSFIVCYRRTSAFYHLQVGSSHTHSFTFSINSHVFAVYSLSYPIIPSFLFSFSGMILFSRSQIWILTCVWLLSFFSWPKSVFFIWGVAIKSPNVIFPFVNISASTTVAETHSSILFYTALIHLFRRTAAVWAVEWRSKWWDGCSRGERS